MLVSVNIQFLHTNPKKIFNLQSTYTFSAKYENFLLLAQSQAMCTGFFVKLIREKAKNDPFCKIALLSIK